MDTLHLLASEGIKNPTLWNPTLVGILTVLSGVALFCGSAYLLLATNLGARLGFLVAAAGLTAFMVLLTTLWWSSGNSGIDPPHGSSPTWHVVDVAPTLEQSKIEAVRDIAREGKPIDTDLLVNLKPAIDAAVVPAVSLHGETPEARPFATLGFSSTTDYLADYPGLKSYRKGDPRGSVNIFWNPHQWAAVQVCEAEKNLSGQLILPARCDPLADTHYVILSHDLGTLRQPVVAYWFVSVLLFGLSLLGLHWYEQDQRARRRAGLAPVPTTSSPSSST